MLQFAVLFAVQLCFLCTC